MNNSPPAKIQLLPHQIPHTQKLIDIWFKQGSLTAIDTSDRGHGKTFVGSYLAQLFQQQYGWKTVVIGPNSQCLDQTNGWLDLAEKHGIQYSWSTTYSALIGRNGKCKHAYLTCDKENKSAYKATEEFVKLCQGGLFLILDECHKATRASRTHWACAALIRACHKYGKKCRILLISNTPADKDDHAIQLLRLSGFIRDTKLVQYDPQRFTYHWENHGLGELMNSATKFTRDATAVNSCWTGLRKGAAKKICINVFKNCLVSRITSAMTPPKMDVVLNAKNAFLVTDTKSTQVINQGLALLTSSVRWNGNDVGNNGQWNMGGITTGLKMIELGKLKAIARYVRNRLRKEPTRKFVLAVGARNIEHQSMLQKMIPIETLSFDIFRAIYQCWKRNPHWRKISKDCFRLIVNNVQASGVRYPTIMNGKTKPKDRVKIMDAFQADNNICNVLIITPGVGSEAISLHDQHGTRKRTAIVIPDHFFVRTVQTAGRVLRVGSKSDAEVMIVYSKEANLETSVLNCMVRKTKTARSMLTPNQKVTFPGEFPYWIEGEKDTQLQATLKTLQKVK